ncbi:S41 family peptidase [Chryseobacterium sp.]|uniref:S41 family peptidase n=1 Tax=Chryseobacterium sp. TaxID=1871047 RepID=UPI00321B59DC
MKYLLITILMFTVCPAQKNPLFEKKLKKDSLILEFAELYHLTNAIHPGEFMFTSKSEFDKTYLHLQNSIKTDLSIVDYYKLTATLMTKIKDGHTAVDRTQITTLLKDRLVFPFSIYKIKDNYYLNQSGNENQSFVGSKIVRINKIPISVVVDQIQKYIHLEGENETGLNTKFKIFPFYYFIYNPTETFEIEYINSKNRRNKSIVKGITYDSFTKSTTENIEPLSTKFETDNLAILKFHSFENGYNESNRKIAEHQLDIFFSKLDNLKTKNLIIDMRDNGGGSAEIANYLFSYLIDQPYYYFDYVGAKYNSVKGWKKYAQNPENIEEINLKETKVKNGLNCFTETDGDDYWWFEKQQNKPNFYKGKISVLINGGCFSTTGHFLALMREYKIGTFFGEYSQGSNYSNSGGQAFILPYSKIRVWIPTLQYKMRTPNFKTDPKGIKPDLEIEIQPNDLKTKFDRPMDFVIKRISGNVREKTL